MYSLAQKCVQMKPAASYNGLSGVLLGILGENTEVRFSCFSLSSFYQDIF